jgi:hypothetical protein
MTDKQNLLKVIGILYCARLPVTSTVMILKNALKLAYVHLNFQKISGGYTPAPPFTGVGERDG